MVKWTKDNPHRCTSIFTPTKGQKYQCMLHEGHEEDHMWFITWHEEHAGDLMQ